MIMFIALIINERSTVERMISQVILIIISLFTVAADKLYLIETEHSDNDGITT